MDKVLWFVCACACATGMRAYIPVLAGHVQSSCMVSYLQKQSNLLSKMWSLFPLAFVCSAILPVARCEVFNLNDRNYPYIFINDPVTAAVIWHSKAFGFKLANSAAVRINARCFFCCCNAKTL